MLEKMASEVTENNLKSARSELYNEIRHRRDIVQKILTFYNGFCALAIGWPITLKDPLRNTDVVLINVFIIAIAVTAIIHLEAHAKSYSITARVIVSLSNKLGLYANHYPEEWKKWGKTIYRWDHYTILFMCIITSIFIVVSNTK